MWRLQVTVNVQIRASQRCPVSLSKLKKGFDPMGAVGESMPLDGYRGEVLLARIRWSKPNRLSIDAQF